MYLAPDGDEIGIADAASEFLAEAMPIERLHSAASADMTLTLRQQLGEMGWFALALPEADGGSGLSAVEHALFFREVGRQCGALDVLSQVLGALTANDADLRAAIVSGESAVALAIEDKGQWRVLGASDARYALQVDRKGAKLFALSGALETRASLAPAISMRVSASAPASIDERSGAQIWRMGELGVAAMLVGLAEAALDLIVEYAKVRETFGRKIGAWQAVRHPCADMAVRVEAARSQLWFAATALKEERADADVHLDAAKHLANQAAVMNADSNIQLHGGIGVTDEHNAHLLLKQAMVLSKLFGGRRALLSNLLHAGVED